MNKPALPVEVDPFVPTPEQRAVIEAGSDESLLVVAGPGTGKTQVAAMRLVHLLRSGLQPAQILVLSFSRSAVATLTKRLGRLDLGDESIVEDLRHLAIRTFDSWAFRQLRQGGATVGELLAHSHEDNIRLVTESISSGWEQGIGDRLSNIRHVIVDEFQDLPGVRSSMVIELLAKLTAGDRSRVGYTVLGDPIQAIYKFAARSESGGEELPDPWALLRQRAGARLREVTLETNHRSTEKLAVLAKGLRKILGSPDLDAARKLAAMKRLLAGLPATAPDAKLDAAWLSQIPDGSLACLTRTNGEALRVAKMLVGDAVDGPPIRVQLRLSGSIQPPPGWIAQLLSRFKPSAMSRATFDAVYAKAASTSDASVWQALHVPPSDIAWCRLARASGAVESTASIDIEALRARINWPDSFPDDQSLDGEGVYITTIHQAKGMEFDNVALLEQRERKEDDGQEDPLEEACVGFVAITRAGRQLGRIPASCIYRAPSPRVFDSGRTRQVAWGKLINVQFGLPTDIDGTTFVDSAVHGSDAAVGQVQSAMRDHAASWTGHKVILRRIDPIKDSRRHRDARYDVHLQDGKDAGFLLGRTGQAFTMDLLDLLWGHGYGLPGQIWNLRIADVVTVACPGEVPASVVEPWRSSRIWFGVTLWGTADFKAWKRNGK